MKPYIICIFFVIYGCSINKQKKNDIRQKEIADRLCEIYISDQKMRKEGVKIDRNRDSLNFIEIMDIIKNYGYPNRRLLGDNYDKQCVGASAFVVLLHHPKKIFSNDDYKNVLIEEYKKGNISEKNFLTIFDKYYWVKNKGKKSYLGIFGSPCIEDKIISDSLRINLGFSPLKLEDFKNCTK